ncbi:hypothetical protein R6Q59_016774 [Mikania micrantha]
MKKALNINAQYFVTLVNGGMHFNSRIQLRDFLQTRCLSVVSPKHEGPILQDIFKSGQKFGSFRVGDSTFYSLIENFAKAGDLLSLEGVIKQMKHERRSFIEGNFILAFKAYGKAKKAEKALDLFDKMEVEYQCTPSVRAFNSVMNVVIQQGLFDMALDFYSCIIIQERRVSPNVLTYNLIIKLLCKLELVDRAIETFREMPFKKCTPDVFTYCTLMDGLCKQDRIDEAVCLLDEMHVEGCFPTSVTFNVLINGLCQKGDLARAAKLVKKYVPKRLYPK